MKFENQYQVDALKYAVLTRGNEIAFDYDELLKFNNTYQSEAMRITRSLYEKHFFFYLAFGKTNSGNSMIRSSYEKILQFTTPAQVIAMNIGTLLYEKHFYHHFDDFLSFSEGIHEEMLLLVDAHLGLGLMTSFEKEQLANNFSLLTEINSKDRYMRFRTIFYKNNNFNFVDAAKIAIKQDTSVLNKCLKWARNVLSSE